MLRGSTKKMVGGTVGGLVCSQKTPFSVNDGCEKTNTTSICCACTYMSVRVHAGGWVDLYWEHLFLQYKNAQDELCCGKTYLAKSQKVSLCHYPATGALGFTFFNINVLSYRCSA